MTEIAARLARPVHRLGLASAVVILLVLVVVLAASAVAVRTLALRNAVLPGVSVAGVDVGGLSRGEAEARIAAEIGPRLDRSVVVTVGAETFSVRPADLFELDAAATSDEAFAAARESIPSRIGAAALPFLFEHEVVPVLDVRASGREALRRRLDAHTAQPRRAQVGMRGLTPVVVPARDGTRVSEAALHEAIYAAAVSGVPAVAATVLPIPPAITTAEAEAAASDARAVVAGPVELRVRRKDAGRLRPRALASLIRFEPTAERYVLSLDAKALARLVTPLVTDFRRTPVDASFRVVGKRARVVPAKPGTKVAAEATAAAVLGAATDTRRVARVVFERVTPDFTTREARALGIRHQVSTFTTLMGESSANRIWNVQLLGRYLDGTIIEPGKAFSYNKVMGPRTAERGFREGHMIWNGVLVPSIGGGVCQTATTIFNAAFEAGLPIRERRNHSFYISHYPMGRDATVSWGGSDLVFKNDLDHAILIKAHGDADTFTVTFYGTRQGRRVVSTTSRPTNYTQPRLQYAIDPSAPRGSVRMAEGGGPGFSVNVHRKVYERGRVIREDDFSTTYTPQNPTQIYGPGFTPPGPYFYLPSSP